MSESHKPARLMIIEDEQEVRKNFLTYAENYPEKIKFVASNNSSTRSLQLINDLCPDGIILDLELNFGGGEGSGMDFLEGLKKTYLDGSHRVRRKPIIIVITNTQSHAVHNLVRDLGVDLIHYKGQTGYSVSTVIKSMLMLLGQTSRPSTHNDPDDIISANDHKTEGNNSSATSNIIEDYLGDDKDANTSSPVKINGSSDDKNIVIPKEVTSLIVKELDEIGMGRHYKGRGYLVKAIEILVVREDLADSVITRVADEQEVTHSSITKAAATAIENTWNESEPEVLQKSYTVHIGKKKRNPSLNEFIYFYAEKVRSIAYI